MYLVLTAIGLAITQSLPEFILAWLSLFPEDMQKGMLEANTWFFTPCLSKFRRSSPPRLCVYRGLSLPTLFLPLDRGPNMGTQI